MNIYGYDRSLGPKYPSCALIFTLSHPLMLESMPELDIVFPHQFIGFGIYITVKNMIIELKAIPAFNPVDNI